MFTLFLLMAEMRGRLYMISREANEINEALKAGETPLSLCRGTEAVGREGHFVFRSASLMLCC